jgi:hypothetical protein
MAVFDRFDIAEAYCLLEGDYNKFGLRCFERQRQRNYPEVYAELYA